jgi:hypothetical protein
VPPDYSDSGGEPTPRCRAKSVPELPDPNCVDGITPGAARLLTQRGRRLEDVRQETAALFERGVVVPRIQIRSV